MTRERLSSSAEAEDVGQLTRLMDIWGLLMRAQSLGYSLIVTPQQAREIAAILDEAIIQKLPESERPPKASP